MTAMHIGGSHAEVVWLVPGDASGSVIVLHEPLSFWGGFDPESGTIIDQRHPQVGTVLTGAVVVMSAGRGSSSASSVIAEAIRLGTAPAAMILTSVDAIVALGAIVADEMYGSVMPIAVVPPALFRAASEADSITLGQAR